MQLSKLQQNSVQTFLNAQLPQTKFIAVFIVNFSYLDNRLKSKKASLVLQRYSVLIIFQLLFEIIKHISMYTAFYDLRKYAHHKESTYKTKK